MDRMLAAFVLTLMVGAIQGFLTEHLAKSLGLGNSEERLRVYHDLTEKINDLRREKSRLNIGDLPIHETPTAILITGANTSLNVVKLEIGNTDIINSSPFDNASPIEIVIEDVVVDFISMMTLLKVLAAKDRQMIFVYWISDSDTQALEYHENARKVPATAGFISDIIDTIDKSHKPLNKALTRIIASGMASHVAGYVGQSVPGLKEITALNPTDKFFGYFDEDRRLDQRDADFVSVYYTSSSIGFRQPVGDINYYFIIGDSYREAPYGSLRKFDLCYHKIGSFVFFSSAFEASIIGQGELQAYECPSAGRFRAGGCHGNSLAQFGYFADTALTGNYFVQMDSYRTDETAVQGASYGSNDYCSDYPVVMRPVRVVFWTQIPRNRGFVMAQSLVDKDGEYNYESNFRYLVNSKAKRKGKIGSSMQVPLLASMEDVKFFLRFRNRLPFHSNYTIDRIVFSWRTGIEEKQVSACDITLSPFVDHVPLDLVPGDRCGGL